MSDQRVLIVDHHIGERDQYRAALVARGLSVDVASTGREAMAMVCASTYEAIVTEVEVPEGGVVALARDLRARPSTMSVPILAIGAASPAAQTIGLDGLLAGAADFIPKPFGCDELLARLQTLFAMSHGASGTGETAACVVDVDSRGYVLTASRAAISALVLPVACRGVHLATHLSQGFDLVPSSSWRDLVELGAEGFMRTLFPNAPGSDVVLEVFPEVQTTGHRLSITPVVVPSWRSHRARVFYRSASSPAAC